MLGRVTYLTVNGRTVTVDTTTGDVAAWELEHDRPASELAATGRVADVAWIAWHAARRSNADPTAHAPFAEWLLNLADGPDPVHDPDDAERPTPPGPPGD